MEKKIMDVLTQLLERQKRIETIVNENNQILRALEHKPEIDKAEPGRIFHELAKIKGEVKGIKQDLTSVELITSKIWNDIARLKAIKE